MKELFLIYWFLLITSSICYGESFITSETLKPLEALSVGLIPGGEKECLAISPEFREEESDVFVDLQFLATGKNGEQSFKSISVPRINLRDFFTNYSSMNGMAREDLVNMPEDQLKSILISAPLLIEGIAKDHAIENALLIHRLSQISNEKEIFETLDSEMRSQSYAKKINFLANFLSYLNDNYDLTSLKNDTTGDIRLTDMDLMKGIQDAIRTGNPVEVGVCRHMHQLAVKMAHAMGIENAYTVGFNTTKAAHMTMILQDPSDRQKVIQLNYGRKLEIVGMSGPEVLSQNHTVPSTGLTFKIFNYKGEHAVTLPSEEGAILHNVTGGDDDSLSPGYKSRAQYKQIGVKTAFGTVRMFYANSPLGNQGDASGVAYDTRLNYNDLFYGEYGVSGFFTNRETQLGNLQAKGLYGRMSQGLQAKVFQDEGNSITLFGEFNLKGMSSCANIPGKECENNFELDISQTFGIESQYLFENVTHRTRFDLLVQETENIAQVDQPIVFSLPVTRLSHDSNFKLNSNLDANLGGSLTFYHIGPGTHATYSSHLGLKESRSNLFFQLNADGRLTESTPVWIPSSEQTLGGRMGARFFGDHLYLNIDGSKSLENEGNYYIGVGLGGSIHSKESE